MIKLQVCSNCKTVHYPERDMCSMCWQDRLNWQDVSPLGHISSFTQIHLSAKPKWQDKLPLKIALIRLEVGVNMLAFIKGNMNINTPVSLTFADGVFTAKEHV